MSFLENIDSFFGGFVNFLSPILFYSINGFPLIVLVLLIGSFTFTFYFKFINIRGFSHSINIIRGKYDNPEDTGQISHFQALTSALSATIGLGNIAGVAVAVSLGGPGAVFWMILIAFFSMTAKFVSCTLGQLFRVVNDDGSVSGGPMYYLSKGIEERNQDWWIFTKNGMKTVGKVLGAMYAVFIIGGAFGGGNMFQANQSYELFGKMLGIPSVIYGVSLALLVGVVIIGGIQRIGKTTEKIVPFMVVLYVTASLFIIFTNLDKLGGVLSSIFNQAFSPHAAYGGFIGALVTGIKRAVFSNEGGVGSASIAHSAAKTDEPVREGIVAMIGPFIDTIVVCFMTASVILITADSNPLDVSKVKIYMSENIDYRAGVYSSYYSSSNPTANLSFSEWEFKNTATEGIVNAFNDNVVLDEKEYTIKEFFELNKNDQDKIARKYNYVILPQLSTLQHDRKQFHSNLRNNSIMVDYLLALNRNGEIDISKTLTFKKILDISYDSVSKTFKNDIKGAELTSSAFGTAISWFPYVLSIVVFLFSFSTMISWYYYGDKGWKYLFGSSSIKVYQSMYLSCIVLGSVASLDNVIHFSDMMILSCAFPNVIGCMFLLPLLRTKLADYWKRYQANEFKVYK